MSVHQYSGPIRRADSSWWHVYEVSQCLPCQTNLYLTHPHRHRHIHTQKPTHTHQHTPTHTHAHTHTDTHTHTHLSLVYLKYFLNSTAGILAKSEMKLWLI